MLSSIHGQERDLLSDWYMCAMCNTIAEEFAVLVVVWTSDQDGINGKPPLEGRL